MIINMSLIFTLLFIAGLLATICASPYLI